MSKIIKNGSASMMIFALLSISVSLFAVEGTDQHPNVVLILTDDQGSVDVNCYGAKDLITPNMDKLAEEGVRFMQFYVGAPVCSPSRASLLTGRYPQRAQLAHNASPGRGMPASQVTIAEILKEAGYRTALFGKWHLGNELPLSPNAQGFDEFLGHKVGCIDNYSHFFYWNGPNRHDLWLNEKEHFEDGHYFPDIIIREAKRFIEANLDQPFFLYLPFNTPHYPLQAEQKFWQMYKDMKDLRRKRYAAFVTSLDDKIGQVLQLLNELNLREKTIVIFLSDHGHSVEERTFGGGGSAGPYRGHKFTLWEGGIRVPCIISWPGKIPQGGVRNQVTSSIDLLPTIAGYCHADLPDRKIDGNDMRSVIGSEKAPSPHKMLYWMKGKNWAVRKGPWKLVYHEGESFLSNIDADVSETENMANENGDIVGELTDLHQEWVKEVVEQ